MKDFAGLKSRITAAVSVSGKDHPYGVLNQEIRALAAEMGVLTTSRKAMVKFEINGHKAALSFSGQGATSQFMLQTDQVSQTPFALCDASEFARLIAATHVPELCELLLQADATATESVAHAIKTVRAVREALILSPPKPAPDPVMTPQEQVALMVATIATMSDNEGRECGIPMAWIDEWGAMHWDKVRALQAAQGK